MTFTKRQPKSDGPDYLAAPFDPGKSKSHDALYVLEFKGRTGNIAFTHAQWKTWRRQAKNIRASAADGSEVKLKSWILAFNYAFENGARDHSTLLVEDPWTASESRPVLEPTRQSIGGIVREHIARQCPKFGAGRLAPSVLTGRAPERLLGGPPVYKIRHPALGNRRYIGSFATRGPDGELIWTPDMSPQLPRNADIETHGYAPHQHSLVRIRTSGSRRYDVHVVHDGTSGIREETIRRILRLVLTGGGGQLFVGQDAGMVRECMTTGVHDELGGEPFSTPIEVTPNADIVDGGVYVEVLPNGAVLADASVVVSDEEDSDWWKRR